MSTPPHAIVTCRLATTILCAGLLFGAGCSRGGATPLDDLAGLLDLSTTDAAAPDLRTADLRPTADLSRPLMNPKVAFAAAVTYPVDVLAFHIAVGRFHRGDTRPDLVTGGSTNLTVLRNQGGGAFTAAPLALGVGGTWQLVAADMNSDGLDDIVAPDPRNGRVVVALANAAGGFDAGTPYPAGMTPQSAAAVDLNGDGALDLVVGSYGSNRVHVFLNNGRPDGSLRAGMSYAIAESPIWISTGDVNRDGFADLVVTSLSGPVNLLAGKGDGTLQDPRLITTASSAVMAALGDADLDGKLDLALIREGVQDILYFQGQGDGSFVAGATVPVSANSGQSVRMADLNADGILDLLAACASSNPARVFLGRGDGTFLPEQRFPGATGNVFDAVPGDLDGDGLVDVVLSEGNDRKISVLLNSTPR